MIIDRNKHTRFRLTSTGELCSALHELGLDLPVTDKASGLVQPAAIVRDLKSRTIASGRTIEAAPNSMCIQPMEGCDAEPDGSPGELTLRRYRRFAAGGAGMIWVEACAVSLDARANFRQLCLTLQNIGSFAELVQEIHRCAAESLGAEHRPFIVLQITHSGRYTRPDPVIAFHDPLLDPARGIPENYPTVTDSEIEAIEEAFAASARLAFAAGFDAVDIKSCHRYLISELLAAHTRSGNYGGSYENRTRFLKNVINRITSLDGAGFEIPPHQGRSPHRGGLIACRFNACDAHPYPYGWGTDRDDPSKPDLAEPKRLVRELRGLGVGLLNVTAGNPYFSPHVNRPYDRQLPVMGRDYKSRPIRDRQLPATRPLWEENPLVGVARLLECAREIQQEVPDIPVVGSGVSWLRHFWPQVASAAIKGGWMQVAGLGRQAFAYPGFAKEILETGELSRNHVCVACSRCSELMRGGQPTGCVPFDSEVYGPLYKDMRGFE